MLASNMEEDALYMGKLTQGDRVPVVGSTQFQMLDAYGVLHRASFSH